MSRLHRGPWSTCTTSAAEQEREEGIQAKAPAHPTRPSPAVAPFNDERGWLGRGSPRTPPGAGLLAAHAAPVLRERRWPTVTVTG